MPLPVNSSEFTFLRGGGEMGALTRAHDWSKTSLGTPDQWPQSLRTTLSIILNSTFPMFLWWGPELIQFYNDAYRPSLGNNGKHPTAVGQRGEECWPEIWPVIKPLLDQVLSGGEAIWSEDQLIPIYRNGQLEDVYWTFSYSPVSDESGKPAGVFVTCSETTEKVVNLKKLAEGKDQLAFAIEATELGTWDLNPITNKFTANPRLKDWFGLRPDEEVELPLAISVIAEKDRQRVAEAIQYALQHESGGRYEIDYTIIHPVTQQERIVRAKGRAWFTDEKTAYRFNGTLQDVTEQKKAEQQQQEMAELLQSVLDASTVGISVLKSVRDEQGEIIDFAYRMTNRVTEQVNNRTDLAGQLYSVVHSGFKQAGLFDTLKAVVETGETRELEIHYTGEGLENWYATVAVKLDDGVVLSFQDVTDRVTASRKLLESETYFRQLTDTVPAIIWETRPDGYCTYLNKQWYELTGQTQAEAEGFGWLDATHPDDKDEAGRLFIAANSTQTSFSALYRLRQKDGSYRWAIDKGSPRFSPNGAYEGMIGTVLDVHNQTLVRQQLEASEAKLRSVIETAPAAIGLFVGRDLVVELPNQTFIDIVGKGPDIVGRPLREVMPELESQPYLQILDDVFTSGKMFQSFGAQVDIVRQGVMTHNFYNITYTPLFDSEGQVYAILDIAIDVTERMHAQQRIEESRQQLLDSFEQSPVGIAIITEENLTFRMANPFYGELTGRTPDQLVGKPLLEALPELRGQGFDKLLNEVFATGIPFTAREVAVNFVRNNQLETIYIDFTYQPQRTIDQISGAEKISAILVVATDITQQVLTRQKIEASEQNLRSLVESAPFPIGVYIGREMRIQLANQAILDVWGKGNDVTGKLYADLLPELESGEIFAQLDAVYTTGVPFHAKNQRVDLIVDGKLQPYYFNYSFTPLYDAEGHVYGVMNTAAEITDLALAKQKVEETEESLRGAIELAELGTWEIDLTAGTLEYSERLRGWFGIGKDETITIERAYQPIREEDRPLVKAGITHAVTPGSNGIYDVEYQVDPAEAGRERILHAQGKAYMNEKGEAYKISGTVQDVTEQRKIQLALEQQVEQRTQQLQASVQDLQRSNQNLQQFAYIASHDLQEPLRKIQSFGDILRKQYADQLGEGVDHLQRMQSAASRMSVLIKDLLAFSRISIQQDTSSSVSLTQVVRAVITDLELTVEETGALIDVGDLPTVPGDPSQLNQLFQNLLSNALKFRRTDPPGVPVVPTVHVQAQVVSAADLPASIRPGRVASAYHRIDVIDNGIGFDEKYVDRIFQVFQRLHGRNEFAGTGIGLAICEKVVANHGGAISATSQPGEGATFSVYLPILV